MEGFITFIKELLPLLVVALPGVLALLSQKRKERNEKDVTSATAKKLDMEAAEKTITMVGSVQDIYREMMTDMKTQLSEYKDKFNEVIKEIDLVKEYNIKLTSTIKEQEQEIVLLRKEVELLRQRIRDLEKQV